MSLVTSPSYRLPPCPSKARGAIGAPGLIFQAPAHEWLYRTSVNIDTSQGTSSAADVPPTRSLLTCVSTIHHFLCSTMWLLLLCTAHYYIHIYLRASMSAMYSPLLLHYRLVAWHCLFHWAVAPVRSPHCIIYSPHRAIHSLCGAIRSPHRAAHSLYWWFTASRYLSTAL